MTSARPLRAAAAVLLAAVAPAVPKPALAKPPTVSLFCTAGIPDCPQWDFRIRAFEPIELSKMWLAIDRSTPWRFAPIDPGGVVGIYEGQDDFGPFSGPTALGDGAATAAIDFLDSGLPFTLAGARPGLLRFAVDRGVSIQASALVVDYSLTTVSGPEFSGRVSMAPEPATAALAATGLAALAGVAYCRRRRVPRPRAHLGARGS
jgi:hypothetical protein